MASFAHLSREERIGLGIAAAAHVALVGALVWQVRDDPTALPIPERMSVSLADEVSLESTAPDPSAEPQASIAPVLSPEPEPVIEPEPVREISRPTPRQTARATERPTPAPTPRATPTRQAGGTRLGDDFLEGVGGSQRSNDRGRPAERAGPAERASIAQAIVRQLKPHWSAPQGADADKLVTVLAWELNPDGTLKGRPRVVRQTGITDSNRPQASLHAERAIRAVQLAAPFDLPDEYYDAWKSIRDATFDRNL
jgi:hypothetical protein